MTWMWYLAKDGMKNPIVFNSLKWIDLDMSPARGSTEAGLLCLMDLSPVEWIMGSVRNFPWSNLPLIALCIRVTVLSISFDCRCLVIIRAIQKSQSDSEKVTVYIWTHCKIRGEFTAPNSPPIYYFNKWNLSISAPKCSVCKKPFQIKAVIKFTGNVKIQDSHEFMIFIQPYHAWITIKADVLGPNCQF